MIYDTGNLIFFVLFLQSDTWHVFLKSGGVSQWLLCLVLVRLNCSDIMLFIVAFLSSKNSRIAKRKFGCKIAHAWNWSALHYKIKYFSHSSIKQAQVQ